MVGFRLYVRYSLSGIRIMYFESASYKDLYTLIGKMYSSTEEKIERIDFETVNLDEVPYGATIIKYFFTGKDDDYGSLYISRK